MHEDKWLSLAVVGRLATFYTWGQGENSEFMNHLLKVLDALIMLLYLILKKKPLRTNAVIIIPIL